MPKHVPIELIVAYLEKSISTEQQEELKSWRLTSDDNESFFQSYKKVWKHSKPQQSAFSPNTNNALQKVNRQIGRRLFIRRIASVAAILIIGLGLSLFVNLFNKSDVLQTTVAASQQTIMLDDSTTVVLAKGAKLQYPQKFNTNKREVHLSGKAYFDVAHDANSPFIVTTNASKTTVLGTKFTLSSKNGDSEQLYLNQGKVSFKTKGLFGISRILSPGEKVTLENGEMAVSKSINDNISAWATGELTFDNATLDQVINTLQKHYNVEIAIANKDLKTIHFSGTLSQNKAEEAIKIICLTLQINYTLKNQTLTLHL